MKKSIPLYVNILTIFIILSSAIVLSVVSYGYLKNSDTAVISAQQLLQRVGSSIVERTQSIFDTAFMTVDTYIDFPQIGEKASIHSHPMSPAFFDFLQQHPDFTSIYIGFADGDFFLASSLRGRENMKKAQNIPDTAMWYTQTIGHADGKRYEFKKYLDEGFVTVGSKATPQVEYDPRSRTWFKLANEADTAKLSDIYVFAMSGEPGVTVSRRFDSAIPGVIGVDISLANLSRFVKRQKISNKCEIMIFDAAGDIYAYPDLEKLVSSINLTKSMKAIGAKVTSLQAPPLTALMRTFHEQGGKELHGHQFVINDTPYLSRVASLHNKYGKEIFIAMAIPETVFTGPIAKIGERTLLVSLGMLLLFIPIMLYAAKRISLPLNLLTQNVENIKAFKLDFPVEVKSHIIEIRELARATETMRGTLRAFGSYIPKPLVESMIVNEISPVLGGERKEMTFMFSDIKDFTTISEALTPEQVTRSITSYLKSMSRVILENNGTIDKYIGDAIMAFWNAPVDDANHAHNACLAVLQCREVLAEFNKNCRDNDEPEFLTRIGVHTGEAFVGNIGSSDRMAYTAMGASVNLASRLEGLNKYLGTDILVSESTMQAAGDAFQFRFAGKVTPKGTSVGLGVYELLGTRSGATGIYAPFAVNSQTAGQIEEWETGFDLFLSRDFVGASVDFSAYIDRHGPDQLVQNYLSLAKEYIVRPPEKSWQGEQTFDAK